VSGVFTNYRGDDSDVAAALIDRELTARFGSDCVPGLPIDSGGCGLCWGAAGAASRVQCVVGGDRAALADPD